MMQLAYPIVLEEDDWSANGEEHGYLVTFPDLPEANTFGNNRVEALASAVDCLEVALAGRIKDREDIPEPSEANGRHTVSPSSMVAAKVFVYMAFRESGLSQAEFARRLDIAPQYVDRLLNPRHHTKMETIDRALALFGKRLTIGVE